MKHVDGIWLPDNEQHLVQLFQLSPKIDGKGSHQHSKLTAALQHVKHKRCAIDIGMHVGLWSMHLARVFKTVIGFEPAAEHVECLRLNMNGFNNYQLHQCALGNRTGSVGLKFFDGSSGSTQIDDAGQGIQMCKLDDFKFDAVDFIKIDVEMYEYFVVEGGKQTIKKHKPTIIIEQKGGIDSPRHNIQKFAYGRKQQDAKKLLESWGAKEKFVMAGDHCMSWN